MSLVLEVLLSCLGRLLKKSSQSLIIGNLFLSFLVGVQSLVIPLKAAGLGYSSFSSWLATSLVSLLVSLVVVDLALVPAAGFLKRLLSRQIAILKGGSKPAAAA
jgi:hypothetical protein